jgi:nitroreductase
MTKPEDFLDLVLNRQSVRNYLSTPVDRDIIERCLEAARLAPSACNSQPWKFIVVDDQALKNAIADETSTTLLPLNHFTKQAPVHIVLVMEKPNITSKIGQIVRDKPFTLIDIGIAAIQFCLHARAEGLGTCILGWFNERNVKKLLNIPKNKRAELIITVGYPSNPDTRPKIRKTIEQVRSYNAYS